MAALTTDGETGSFAPVPKRLLRRLAGLNVDYLELLATDPLHPESPDHGLQYLPRPVVQQLASLSCEARLALGRCPFALFTLGFGNAGFWTQAVQGAEDATAHSRYCRPVTAGPPSSLFADAVLTFAWHLAMTSRISARLLLGMTDPVADVLKHAPLWHLRRITSDYPDLVMPRWPGNPCFWPDVIRFAARADWTNLANATVLGRQLTAAELDVAAATGRRIGKKC
jgi:hypothetical protein